MHYSTLYSSDSNYKLEINYDEDPSSPAEEENDGLFLVFDHRKFNIEVNGFEPRTIFDYMKENNTNIYKDYFIVPIQALIHSNVYLSLLGTTSCKWDTSTTGYILVHKDFTENYSEAESLAQGLLKEWNIYLNGEVYCYSLYKKEIRYSILKETYDRLLFEDKLFELEEYFTEESEWELVDSISNVHTENPEDVDNGILYDLLLENDLAGEFNNG